MTPAETTTILRQFNEWQRGDGPLDYVPSGLINAIDAAIEMIDRLEAAEKERDALRAKIETAENDTAHQKAFAASALRVAEGWERKCGELRAKISAMEQQAPVATVRINAINGNPSVDFVPGHRYLHHNDKLYLAPGAKGE